LRAGHPDVQRVVEEEVDLGCTSTPELTCDAGTPGTLGAGVLGRFEGLAHLPSPCSSGRVQARPAESHLDVHFLLGHVRVFSSEVDGSTTLDERRRTIYFRAENSNVAEQERNSKEHFSRSRCDAAEEHVHRRCASSSNLPRTPALSVPRVTASQASSGVDLQPRSASSSTTR
jgi:hypothetical protein